MNTNLPAALFDGFQRTDKRSARETEPRFAYMNLSARPGFVATRELLEDWFISYPDVAKPDLRSRFRSKNNHEHAGAFFELFLYQYLRRLGFEVELHPDVEGKSTHPDFLTRRNGIGRFYTEAIVPQVRQISPGEESRKNQIHEALQRITSADFFLWVDYDGYPTDTPKLSSLIKRVEEWLATLDYDKVRQLCKGSDYIRALPRLRLDAGGMKLNIHPIPKDRTRGQTEVLPVGIFGQSKAQMVDSVSGIRGAGVTKSKKYGRLQLPYVVAINSLEPFARPRIVADALFGREGIRETWRSTTSEFIRLPDGLWIGKNGPINTHISAALVFLGLTPWNLTTVEARLAHNPFAIKPLADSLAVKQIVADLSTGKLAEIPEERRIEDVLGLPNPWPIPDDDEA